MPPLSARHWDANSDTITDPAFSLRPISCLLLDDSRFDRRRVIHTAARAGLRMDVTEVSTLAEARDALLTASFSLHVFDFRLPDGDGIEFAREVLSNTRHNAVPTIILSGQGRETTSLTAFMAGCADYLTKETLSPTSFHSSVINALHKAALRAELNEAKSEKDAINAVLQAICDARINGVEDPISEISRQANLMQENGGISSELQTAIDTLSQNCHIIATQLTEIEKIAGHYDE